MRLAYLSFARSSPPSPSRNVFLRFELVSLCWARFAYISPISISVLDRSVRYKSLTLGGGIIPPSLCSRMAAAEYVAGCSLRILSCKGTLRQTPSPSHKPPGPCGGGKRHVSGLAGQVVLPALLPGQGRATAASASLVLSCWRLRVPPGLILCLCWALLRRISVPR